MHQEHPTDVLMHERWRWRPPLSRTAAVYRSLRRDSKLTALWMSSPFKLRVMALTTCARDFAPPLPPVHLLSLSCPLPDWSKLYSVSPCA